MVIDQVKRFKGQTRDLLHEVLNDAIVLIGFAMLGVTAGSLLSFFLGLVGVVF